MEKGIQQPEGDLLQRAVRRLQSVTSDWALQRNLIAGVQCKDIRSVLKNNGYLTEIYRTDWQIDEHCVKQVFQSLINPGSTEAWHIHKQTTDRFLVGSGRLLLVLYDDRNDSPTKGLINEFHVGIERPSLISVPPGVWHGVKNVGESAAILLNLVDKAYNYEAPDHWGIPYEAQEIPYTFPD